MKSALFSILSGLLISIVVVLVAVNIPSHLISVNYWKNRGLLGAFTQISGSTTVADFPTIYNANLGITIETGTTSVASITTLNSLTSATSLATLNSLTSASALATIGTITSGVWNGTLIGIPYGGTGWASFNTGSVLLGNGTTRLATSSNLFFDTTNSRLGIASTSPAYGLSLGSQKAIGVTEYFVTPTTSPITIDARNGNQQLIQLGGNLTATTTIQFSNMGNGTVIRLIVCNPSTKAASTTFSGVKYPNGTMPTQTQTANVCDSYVVGSTQATSTTATTPIIWLAQGFANLQ